MAKRGRKPRIIKMPLPSSMHNLLVFVAAMQNFELIPPIELSMNINAYIVECRGAQCLEIDKKKKLKAYLKKWKLVDFTEYVKGENDDRVS